MVIVRAIEEQHHCRTVFFKFTLGVRYSLALFNGFNRFIDFRATRSHYDQDVWLPI